MGRDDEARQRCLRRFAEEHASNLTSGRGPRVDARTPITVPDGIGAAFDGWFAGDDGKGPDNASLAAIGLHAGRVPAFRALLAEAGGDLPRFYARARAAEPNAERNGRLEGLAPTPAASPAATRVAVTGTAAARAAPQ